MERQYFFRNRGISFTLEQGIRGFDTFEEFEKRYSEDFLNDDTQIGDYLGYLLDRYDRAASNISEKAGLATAYVGLIVNGKKNNPSRNALISICLAIGTTFEEAQYLLKYAGKAPLYVRRKRDVVIWFGFMKGQDFDEVNANLIERGYEPLAKE